MHPSAFDATKTNSLVKSRKMVKVQNKNESETEGQSCGRSAVTRGPHVQPSERRPLLSHNHSVSIANVRDVI